MYVGYPGQPPSGGALGPFPAAVALADNLANPTTTEVGANLLIWDGTQWLRVKDVAAGTGLTTGLPAVGRYAYTATGGGTWRRLITATTAYGNGNQADNMPGVVPMIYDATGNQFFYVRSTDADSVNAQTGGVQGAGMYGYSGALDRWRNNTQGTLLASAARSASTSSADQTNYNGRGVKVYFNITAVPGIDTVTLAIEDKDPISGAYTAILTGVAQVATGLTILTVYPGGLTTANLASPQPLPRTWRVTVTHSAGTSFTYSVAFATIV